jgi:large subunit ribosomal protein L3
MVDIHLVAGSVSGPKGCVVRIQDAIKKPWPEIAHVSKTAA